jgi:aryl-alcohol dehydrogenase-like predicted oxidoreductase
MAKFDALEALEEIAAAKRATLSQLALAWLVAQPGVTAPILGPRTLDQLHDNLGALEVKITAEDRATIDRIVAPAVNFA